MSNARSVRSVFSATEKKKCDWPFISQIWSPRIIFCTLWQKQASVVRLYNWCFRTKLQIWSNATRSGREALVYKIYISVLSKTGVKYIPVTIISRNGMKSFPKCCFFQLNVFFSVLKMNHVSCWKFIDCIIFYLRPYTTDITHYWNKKKFWEQTQSDNCVIEWKYSYSQVCVDGRETTTYIRSYCSVTTDHYTVFSSYSLKV